MKCYTHREADAVGTCRSCGRGVCFPCAAEVGKAIACRGRCEDDVRGIGELLARNVAMMRPIGQTFAGTASVYRLIRRLLLASGRW